MLPARRSRIVGKDVDSAAIEFVARVPPSELRESIDRSLAELDEVRRAMGTAERSFANSIARVDAVHADGARNLAHYLALRSLDLRPLQARLVHLGLSSLGRCEGHALASVEAVLAMLRELAAGRGGAPLLPKQSAFQRGSATLDAHTHALLGPPRAGRGVRILVTLDPKAAEDVASLRAWIEAGMDCVRINCAHDGPDQWSRIVDRVRRAEAASGRKLRILMDLAGPKLRTGPIEPGPRVRKIKPRRDALGKVVAPARVLLSPADGLPSSVEGAHAVRVSAGFVEKLAPGDRLEFVDARGAERSLCVVRVLRDGAWTETDRTCYLLDGTTLSRRRKPIGRVDGIAPLEGEILLKPGERLVLTQDLEPGSPAATDDRGIVLAPARIGCTLDGLFSQVCAGERVLFDDGRLGGVIRDAGEGSLEIEITEARACGEKLRADKGINLPDSRLELPGMTAKDREDLAFVAKHADAVALSFVHGTEYLNELSQELARLGREELGIVLKIETRRGFERLPELLFAAMRGPRIGVMIARGDLAVECGWERLAEIQEEILWLCEAAHVPVIWATQVLEHLAKEGRPSRAEITDAAMSERAECVMLNKGPHVGDAIAALDGILRRMQAHQRKKTSMLRRLQLASFPSDATLTPPA
jgi:pyruvate kinase